MSEPRSDSQSMCVWFEFGPDGTVVQQLVGQLCCSRTLFTVLAFVATRTWCRNILVAGDLHAAL